MTLSSESEESDESELESESESELESDPYMLRFGFPDLVSGFGGVLLRFSPLGGFTTTSSFPDL